jgi:Secretion system C-terminal sorting domain
MQVVFNIAEQCPLAGGNAIIIARALYAFIDYKKRYNDREICNRENIELKQPGTGFNKSRKLSLHPNPANTTVTLSYNMEELTPLKMILMNTTGQVVQQHILNANENSFEFSIENLNPGVYYVKIRSLNSKDDVLKLVIVR